MSEVWGAALASPVIAETKAPACFLHGSTLLPQAPPGPEEMFLCSPESEPGTRGSGAAHELEDILKALLTSFSIRHHVLLPPHPLCS